MSLLEELETVLFGAVHDVSDEDKISAARSIKDQAHRVGFITEDWNTERERAEFFRDALRTVEERLDGPNEHHTYGASGTGRSGIHMPDCAACGTLQFVRAMLKQDEEAPVG